MKRYCLAGTVQRSTMVFLKFSLVSDRSSSQESTTGAAGNNSGRADTIPIQKSGPALTGPAAPATKAYKLDKLFRISRKK